MPQTTPAARSIEDRNALVVQYLPLVGWTINRFAPQAARRADYEDLFSACLPGLITAAERYDPSRGKFTTFAVWWIRQKLTLALASNGPVRLPTSLSAAARSRALRRARFGRLLFRDGDPREPADPGSGEPGDLL